MKVASWNIAGGHRLTSLVKDAIGYEKEDLSYFTEQLRSVNADVICLQEAHTSKDNKYIQAQIIADKLGYCFVNHSYTGGESHIKKDHFLSLATLSKYPIISSYFHQVPNPHVQVKKPNGSVWVSLDVGFLVTEIDYEGKKIYITNTHLVPFHYYDRNFMEPEFKNIRESITKLLLSLTKEPCISAGDFNFKDLKQLLPEVFKDYKGAFIEDTTPEKGQQDHILYSNYWKMQHYNVKKVNADHYICLVEIELL